MADNSMEMTHAEMWDDSALIDSWNEALDETIAAQTEAVDQPEIVDDAEGANKPKGAGSSTDVQTNPNGVSVAKAISGHGGNGPGPATTGPQSLLGTVQDESLKRLLMSWYYAGYYTGLYEGQQQQQQQQQSK
ncbi:survival motor neuron-like protein 1 [Colletotrichum incanum]|nr:survival motor neuron-like protein 1 [Colletotrichum incanum]